MDGELYIFFQFSDERCGCIWSQQASHIFDAENIRPHVFKVFPHFDIEIYIVDRADGIADTTFDCFSAFFHGVNGCFYISEIIEYKNSRVEIFVFFVTAAYARSRKKAMSYFAEMIIQNTVHEQL